MINTYSEYMRQLEEKLKRNNYKMIGAFEIDEFIQENNIYENLQLLHKDVWDDAEKIIKDHDENEMNDNIELTDINIDEYELTDIIMNLKNLILLYSESINNINLVKSLLSDFFPNDKLLRNLLLACVSEGIVQELVENPKCDKYRLINYKKRLINAYGCSDSKAEEIISYWISAIDINDLE